MKSPARSRGRGVATQVRVASNTSITPVRTDLFAPPPDDDPDASDPAVLSRTATLASGRAMTARLWAEARALAALAES